MGSLSDWRSGGTSRICFALATVACVVDKKVQPACYVPVPRLPACLLATALNTTAGHHLTASVFALAHHLYKMQVAEGDWVLVVGFDAALATLQRWYRKPGASHGG